jgi:hypothetical protein
MGAVYHDQSVGSFDETMVATPDLGLHEHVAGYLLHGEPPLIAVYSSD